jgi:hypothetical protein
MLNNLMIVRGDHGYGYDSYYLARKNEELSFPSDVAIASSFGATNYEVKTVNLPVEMTVSGTLINSSETPTGYLAKVAKHFPVMDEVILREIGGTSVEYVLVNTPTVGNVESYIRGTIYDGATAIQTFTVARGTTSLAVEKIGESEPEIRVTAGSIAIEDKKITLTWNQDPGASSIVVDYEYMGLEAISVLSKVNPVADQYDNVSVYGLTSIKTKYIKIMTNFKCKIPAGYTYSESRVFYTRCKYKSNSCSSNSNAIVPAITVCNQRLF